MKRVAKILLGLFLILAAIVVAIVGLFASGFMPESVTTQLDALKAKAEAEIQAAQDGQNDQNPSAAASASPTDIATGEASIAKVRMVFNGKDETRPEFTALREAAKELTKNHYDVQIIENHPAKSREWELALNAIAASDADILVAGSGQLAPWVANAVKAHPKKYWITWDSDLMGEQVTNIKFDNYRGSVLAGRVAGMATVKTDLFPKITNPDTKILGVVVAFPGMDSDPFINGVRDGAKQIDEAIDVRINYIHSMDNYQGAYETTKAFYQAGAEVVVAFAGKGTEGAMRAAREFNKQLITLGSDDSKAPKDQILATLVRPFHRVLVDHITGANPERLRTVEVGVGTDDVYVEVRPDVDPKVAQDLDDQIEAWEDEEPQPTP